MNFNYSMIELDNTNTENMKVITGPHAFELLDKLMLAYYDKKPPYDKIILPQSLKPKSLEPSGEYYGTEEHVMYFWNVCSYMSGRIKSDLAFKKTTEIFNNHPELFSCKNLADTDVEKIESILKQHNLGRRFTLDR